MNCWLTNFWALRVFKKEAIILVDKRFFNYFLLQIADAVRGSDTSNVARQKALLYGLFTTPFVSLLGAVSYHLCANYLVHDKETAESSTKASAENIDQKDLETLPPTDESNESLNEDMNEDDQEQLIPNLNFSHENHLQNPDFNIPV